MELNDFPMKSDHLSCRMLMLDENPKKSYEQGMHSLTFLRFPKKTMIKERTGFLFFNSLGSLYIAQHAAERLLETEPQNAPAFVLLIKSLWCSWQLLRNDDGARGEQRARRWTTNHDMLKSREQIRWMYLICALFHNMRLTLFSG